MEEKRKPCIWCNNYKQAWLYVQGVPFMVRKCFKFAALIAGQEVLWSAALKMQ